MSGRRTRFLMLGLFVTALWTIGVYYYEGEHSHHINTPQHAIKSYLHEKHWKDWRDAVVLPDKAKVNGGYLMVVKTPNVGKTIFYVTVQEGQWTAINTQSTVGNGPQSSFTPLSETKGLSIAIVQRPEHINIVELVGYRRDRKGEKDIPFTFVRLGKFHIWGYVFTTKTQDLPARLVAYNQEGKKELLK